MKKKILIIEDEAITYQVIRAVLESIMSESTLEFEFAKTKDSAINLLKQEFDLITLDGSLLDGSHGRDILREMSVEQIGRTIIHSGENDFVDECSFAGMRAVHKCRSIHDAFEKHIKEMGLA